MSDRSVGQRSDQAAAAAVRTCGDKPAFSAFCTHAGCPVSTIRNGEIGCPCHGSTFDIADGSVLGGPATTGLCNRVIEIRDDNVVLMADS
ncbi:Rieske (2Fe-2S) protein [Streptomyces sp. NPDC127077]|uniref:Rieske (2Fe-2S) protein n=1 Tax=Streptomyces sp. NPDC127077 TaxID=3347131 RepID=UPI003667DCE4